MPKLTPASDTLVRNGFVLSFDGPLFHATTAEAAGACVLDRMDDEWDIRREGDFLAIHSGPSGSDPASWRAWQGREHVQGDEWIGDGVLRLLAGATRRERLVPNLMIYTVASWNAALAESVA